MDKFRITFRTKKTKIKVGMITVIITSFLLNNFSIAKADISSFQKRSDHHIRVICFNVNWDSIFPDNNPNNHPWRNYDKSDEFVRIIQSVQPDIICLQEIGPNHPVSEIEAILQSAIPLTPPGSWNIYHGADDVIATRFSLSLQENDTIPTTNRGHAQALVDLPDNYYPFDMYLINAHFKSGGGESNIARRQQHADACIYWLDDARSPGGNITLEQGTAMVIMGDLNVYDTDPANHLYTLRTGDIFYEASYGNDSPPDWDGSDIITALPHHNAKEQWTYTWRNDNDQFNPGPLDHVLYTDSIISIANRFVLHTNLLTDNQLTELGLHRGDEAINYLTGHYDHLPLIVDFFIPSGVHGDGNGDGVVSFRDIADLKECLSGPGQSPDPVSTELSVCQSSFDLNNDNKIDLKDIVLFQQLLD